MNKKGLKVVKTNCNLIDCINRIDNMKEDELEKMKIDIEKSEISEYIKNTLYEIINDRFRQIYSNKD